MPLVNIDSLSRDVHKVDDGFYIGKIAGKDLRVVMERVDNSNIKSWLRYAEIQNNSTLADLVSDQCNTNGQVLQKGSLSEGNGHFQQVLESVSYDVNEVWVAYITKAKHPEKIPSSMANYGPENVLNRNHPFAMNIEMFVSISSSPEALITSHMGVASSIEGMGNRTKGTSVDLHSFAARVMLILKPERKYMVNAPTSTMEIIFAKALPGFFHAGTIEMQQKKRRQSISQEVFQNIIIPKKSRQSHERAKLNPNDPRVIKRMIKSELMEEFSLEDQFYYYENPYPFKSAKKETMAKEFLEFMDKNPPILSVRDKKIVIFKPHVSSEADIVINLEDKEYKWMSARVLKPSFMTHYVAIDLLVLANCKALDPIQDLY